MYVYRYMTHTLEQPQETIIRQDGKSEIRWIWVYCRHQREALVLDTVRICTVI